MDKFELKKIMYKQISDKLLSATRTPQVSKDGLAKVINLEYERLKRRNKS